MKNIKNIAITLFAISVLGTTAQADSDKDTSLVLSFAGVANDKSEEVNTSDISENDPNYGFAVLGEINIRDRIGFETGVILIDKQYDASAGGARFVQTVQRMHIPLTVRFWATDFLSVAAGPYASFKTGSVENSVEIGDTSLGTVETSADDSVQFGLDLAATVNFAINDKTGIFVEGRYSMPFDEESNETADEVYGLAGVKIDL